MHYSLRKKLLMMFAQDQALRCKGADTSALDHKHLLALQQIVHRYGWPTYRLVGKRGAHAAWVLVQHADASLSFQKHCLCLLQQALAKQQVAPMHVAYLTDRLLVHEGKKQLYGTQFYVDHRGIFRPKPIAQRKTLDQRRLQMGLVPFAEYELQMHKIYSPFK